MISDTSLYLWVFIWVTGTGVALVLVSLAVGWWGLRKARREGRYCDECGLQDEPVDILIHRIREHDNGQ